MMRRSYVIAMIAVFGLGLLAGCSRHVRCSSSSNSSKEDKGGIDVEGAAVRETGDRPGTLQPGNPVEKQLLTVYFDFDKSDIRADQTERLRKNAEVLKAHPQVTILVEGHCDERGTNEYNMALGQRRASAVRETLLSLGVDAKRVTVVSKGEEQPVDPGHSEAAWAKNRRAEFKVTL